MNEARDSRRDARYNQRMGRKKMAKERRLVGVKIYSHNWRCFWTWPWGHVRFWSRRRLQHTRCAMCGEL